MKKRICALLAPALLLGVLSACSLDAAPDVTIPSDNSQNVTPVATEATKPAQTLEAWTDNEIRALIPEPPGKIMDYDETGMQIGLMSATREDLEEYCQQLLDAGFDEYYDFEESILGDGSEFTFQGRNAQGIVIRVDAQNRFNTVSGSSLVYIQDFRQTESSAEQEPWGIDEFQQQLPDPGFTYVSAQLYHNKHDGQDTRLYSVNFAHAMDYTAFREYAEELRAAGFVYKETVNDNPFQNQFTFSAENAEGYLVSLTHASSGYPALTLVEPGREGSGRDWDDDGYRSCFPDPDCTDFSERNTSYLNGGMCEYTLKGMDYEGLKTYAQMLQESGFTQLLFVKDDLDAQSYLFAACGIGTMGNESGFELQLFVRLSFDPTQTSEDGTLYCLMEISTFPFPENEEAMREEKGLA